MGRPSNTSSSFWKYVDRRSDNECWLWKGTTLSNGYGQFYISFRKESAHRYSYTLAFGKIPSGSVVMHKCDNPACVNPKHLQLGTSKENTLDMMQKGRARFGGSDKNLTPDDVNRVLELHQQGQSTPEIAKALGIGKRHVLHIIRGERWGWLTNITRVPR